jgi:chromosome segregation ATPase
MKTYLKVLFLIAVASGCQNNDVEKQQVKTLRASDSTLMMKTQAQDSTITAYIKSFNEIQDNMDSIKMKQKIINVNAAGGETKDKKTAIIADMKYISEMLSRNKKEVAAMSRKLKESGAKNADLEKMIAHLSEEITEKDADIASLQNQLQQLNAQMAGVIQKFNDSMLVIQQKEATINEMEKVSYAIGTVKELKQRGVIIKEGGILGIGSETELKKNFNTAYFTNANMYSIHSLPLYSKLDKIVTTHPTSSYNIVGDKKTDSLIITDPKAFWSNSKYLVILVKPH